MLSLLWTIIIGFVVGFVARARMPGKQAFGFTTTTALGVVGALVVLFVYGAVMKKRDE